MSAMTFSSTETLTKSQARSSAIGSLFDVLRLPPHRGEDAGAPARVVEEDQLFDRTRIQLAIFTKLQRHRGEPVWLAGRIQAEDVGFVLVDANDRVVDRRRDELKD